jgi:hypothetical protein
MVTWHASIFERSRTSLMSVRRSLPEYWMIWAYLVCSSSCALLVQFGLLLLQPRLRFLQGPALFFQLLVGDAQFLALDLQLLRFMLHFGQQGA